jgi:hypothetical protein
MGVLRDVVLVANDHAAPLARKLALFDASAVMRSDDRTRLHAMLGVVQSATVSTASTTAKAATAPPGTSAIGERAPVSAQVRELPTDVPSASPGELAGEPLRSIRRRGSPKRPYVLHPHDSERRIRALLASEPSLSTRALAKHAKVSQSTASKYRRLVAAEGKSAQQSTAQ